MADSHYDNVTLLLPFNEAAGAQTFVDQSKYGRTASTLEYHSSATVDMDGASLPEKHYATSLKCASSYDGVNVAGDGDAFELVTAGTSTDFTIECHTLMDPGDAHGMFIGNLDPFYLFLHNGNAGYCYVEAGVLHLYGPSAGLSLDLLALGGFDKTAWHHVALSRSGGYLFGFFDGVQIGAAVADTGTITSGALNIGHNNDSSYWAGYIQDFRVTDGVGRYTSGFTPPGALIKSISGAVTGADGNPAERTIIAVPRAYPCGKAWSTQSSNVDGSYSLEVADAEVSRIVLADEVALYNDIVDRVLPG